MECKDEIGTLAMTFKKMSNKLNEVLNNINSSANQVAVGSKQIANSSMSLSKGAARSASAAKETTEMIEGCISKAQNGTNIANETAKAYIT